MLTSAVYIERIRKSAARKMSGEKRLGYATQATTQSNLLDSVCSGSTTIATKQAGEGEARDVWVPAVLSYQAGTRSRTIQMQRKNHGNNVQGKTLEKELR